MKPEELRGRLEDIHRRLERIESRALDWGHLVLMTIVIVMLMRACRTTQAQRPGGTTTPGRKERNRMKNEHGTDSAPPGSLERMVSRPREITPDDVTKEADRNYDLGRKHGREEKADLLDWAETLLCNALPMSHCTQQDWDAAVKKWRDEKHGVAKSANMTLDHNASLPHVPRG